MTGQNSAGSAEQVTKNIGPIGGAGSGPVNISAPEISGTPTVGGQLVADPGTWSGSPTSYSYQWQRRVSGDWDSITGATASAYTPSTADSGDPLRVVVTATNAGGQSVANSSATAAVTNPAQPPVNTTLPAISGQTVIGSTLTTTNGTWTGSPDDYDYQWQRSTASGGWAAISGATRSAYTATNADNGMLLRVTVTADNDAGSATTMAPEVGPVTNPAGTCTVTPQTDTDNDGIPDCKEITGFTLSVSTTGAGSVAQRKVTSDPNNPDTDGDKINDGLEWQGSASDPSSSDTDGDGLTEGGPWAGFLHPRRIPTRRRECAAVVSSDCWRRGARLHELDTARVAPQFCLPVVKFGGRYRGHRTPRRPWQHNVTQRVYRKELRPVIRRGAQAMDAMFVPALDA